VAGWTTTAACKQYGYAPSESAHSVHLLLAAGAICIGKANLDQFATGLVGTRSPYGACENSFNPLYISGGSSSGSAVALAQGFCSFSLGTDTAGSGRIPAAFNNLVGLKPSKGRISTRGVVPACKSLDCLSVFALTCADAEAVLKVMEGFDVEDPYSQKFAADVPTPAPGVLKPFRFGVPKADQLAFFGCSESPALFAKAIIQLEALGGERVEMDYGLFTETANLLYEGPWVAERLAVIEEIMRDTPEILTDTTRAIIGNGNKYSAVDVYKAMYRLESIKNRVQAYWSDFDFLVTPTAGRAYTIDAVNKDPVQLNTNLGHYTNFMNLLDMVAVAVPSGFVKDGPGFGVTISCPSGADAALLGLGQRFQTATGLPLGNTGEQL
jgi:allophanate hydrolase